MFRIIKLSLGLLVGLVGPSWAQEADPVESKLVAEAQASALQQQHFIEAVKNLVEARDKEKVELGELRGWVRDYFTQAEGKGK